MRRKYVVYIIIIIQLFIIFIVGKNIFNKYLVNNTPNINKISSNDISYSKNDELKFFYEPKANTVINAGLPGMEPARYTINSESFNQINESPISKKHGTYRILTIGDSFTFGQNVNTEENYPSQLEKTLNTKLFCTTIKQFEVINLGVFGYDIQYTIERFKRRGIKYDPDLVIWLFIPGDFLRVHELFFPKLNEYKNNKDYDTFINDEYNNQWTEVKNQVIEELGGEKNILNLQKKYINKINSFYTKPLLLSIFPYKNDDYNNLLKKFATERKETYFLQLSDLDQINGAKLPDFHPSALGYKIIANTFMNYLVNKHIVDCSLIN